MPAILRLARRHPLASVSTSPLLARMSSAAAAAAATSAAAASPVSASPLVLATAAFVRAQLQSNDASHDWRHIERVWTLARTLAEEEVGVQTCQR